ncbi:MAG: SAM-dependent methyltransferase [Nitrospirae bacterium]|nr:SAM-dependent methyltransferase [Nitrospirota bacterium]
MNKLEQKIIEKIRKEGPISFETFMEMALYEPGLGYYASERTEIGKSGDFYTSAHIHYAFGAMIGRQIEEMWEIMGRPEDFLIIEIGTGAGYMCKDILDFLRSRSSNSLNYLIIENNPFMQNRQMRLLEDHLDKIKWVYSLSGLRNLRGCIVSNELLDAFPVSLIEMEDSLKEVFVTVDKDIFRELKRDPSKPTLFDYLKEFSIELSKGYRTEINLRIKDWLKFVNDALSEGFILTIDYGYPANDYYSEERNRGTLLCYHKHQLVEDPYINIGEQDMTAHVNFSSVKKWGEELGFKTIGFCQQGTFLISLGIDEIVQELYKNSSGYLFEVARIKRLILPGTLGESHKVLIQYKGKGFPELRGFSIKNQADRL